MKLLKQGKYLGTNQTELSIGGIVVCETIYREDVVSQWHRHENPYLTFILNGGCIEQRKAESMECAPGNLFFYRREELHRNYGYQRDSRFFSIEFNNAWIDRMDITSVRGIDNFGVGHPDQKFLLLKILKEYRVMDKSSSLSIEAMTIGMISDPVSGGGSTAYKPNWARKLEQTLRDSWRENFSLKELSLSLGVHPVTISRYFPRYFNCTIGEYIRKIRIDKSLHLIRTGKDKLTDIAYTCGFADQSHFTRTFKGLTGVTPNEYRGF